MEGSGIIRAAWPRGQQDVRMAHPSGFPGPAEPVGIVGDQAGGLLGRRSAEHRLASEDQQTPARVESADDHVVRLKPVVGAHPAGEMPDLVGLH